MTRSASTPRLRLTVAYYVLLIIAAATLGPPALPPRLDLTVELAALLLVSLAALGRIWCSVFIAGRKDAELVTAGPYALCRHPLYALSLIGGLGLGLATRSIALTLVTLAVLATLLGTAARTEEHVLASRHAQEFAAYAARVPRWWPRWSNWHMPSELRVPPAVLWKAFVDAGAFLLLFALVDAAHTMRASGISPTLLALP